MNSDVVRIGSCILACDMACMVRFYRDTLGLQTDWDGGNFAEFKTASGPVSFWLYSRKEFVKAFGEAYVPPKGMISPSSLLFGFLIYAFMYGAIGSTASKLEDINTSVMPITFLFIIAFFVVMFSMTSGSVDSTLMKVCSYIPFTSPMAMFTRLCMSTVAWYEIAVSIAILIGSTVGIGMTVQDESVCEAIFDCLDQ